MKRWIAALTALCVLALGLCALAEETEAQETALPDPEVVIEMTEAPATEAPETEEEADEEAEEGANTVWFEEGFGLEIPAGWVSYPVAEADRDAGTRYILGDGTGTGWVYIQVTPTGMKNVKELTALVENEMKLEKTGDLVFGTTPFVAFLDRAQDASGCATLWHGSVLAFVFSPQSNSEFIMQATEVMESFMIA